MWYQCKRNGIHLQFAERIAAALLNAFGGDPKRLYNCGFGTELCNLALSRMPLLNQRRLNVIGALRNHLEGVATRTGWRLPVTSSCR